jgi:RNA polymerase sigma-70 factor, ECF subfamily
MDPMSERELIRRCRHGATAAYEPIVRWHEPRALALARALLGDADEAADAVQEAFVRAWRGLRGLRDGTPFGPWFRTILRNHCRDRLRAPARRDGVAWSQPAIDRQAWTEPAGSGTLEREQLACAVRSALAELSDEHREILVLKEMEEMSYAEIAAAAGIPAGTVASRLHHARVALREVLERRGITREEGR